ncbi:MULTISPECIES: TetR-like C-terminal domain-containing protein [unclassified Pseudarthrobacter]|uniref:TetR-like C-terminal domain-containing protein n=1 Tax=unclassified Pseudarthrobacter TaxID=2647000 RepID=UPI00362BAD76
MARPVVHTSTLRDELLSVAADLVDRNGPAKITVRDVAAAAGTSTTAVYSLFGGKSELLAAVVDDGFRSFGSSQEAALKDGLRGLGIAYRHWALSHPALYRLMFGGALASFAECLPSPDATTDAMGPLKEAVTAAQPAEGRLAAPVEIIAAAIWGQVHGLVSLELAQVGPPGMDWDAAYDAALEAIARSWTIPVASNPSMG